MAKKFRDPEAPEVLDAIHDRMRKMTRDEWIAELAYKPEGVRETFRTARAQAADSSPKPAPSSHAASRKPINR